jgi:thioredoxin-like negative regulator of GroEL
MIKPLLPLILSLSLLSCGGGQAEYNNSNTELVVHYEGKEVHRRGGKYISEQQLRKLLESGEELIVIFSADWCSGCDLARKAIKQAKLKTKVYYINIDEPWAQKIAAMMKIKTVPLMLHVGSEGQTLGARIGPGSIVVYLVLRY